MKHSSQTMLSITMTFFLQIPSFFMALNSQWQLTWDIFVTMRAFMHQAVVKVMFNRSCKTCICLSSFSDNLSCLLSLKLYIYIQDNLSDRIKLKQCLLIAVLWLHCFLSQFFLLLYMTSKTLYFKRWINDKCTAADVVYSPNLQLPNFSSKQGY